MKTNTVEISYTGHNFSAYLPSLPGCISTGTSPEENNIQEAVNTHLAGMKEDGEFIPESYRRKYLLVFKFDTQSL